MLLALVTRPAVPAGRGHGDHRRAEERGRNATQPVGTGPYQLDSSEPRSASATLLRWDGYRNASQVKTAARLSRFISDPSALASLLSGDVDALPARGRGAHKPGTVQRGKRALQIPIGGSRARSPHISNSANRWAA